MRDFEPLAVLPADIQRDWQAALQKASPTTQGVFRLVGIRRTEPLGHEGQRITVLVVDENGFPLSGVRVAFSYSTAQPYLLTSDYLWSPPAPYRAHVVPTAGSGQIDQIQGSSVKRGEPGGVACYILEPEYASDVVAGLGMLSDHTGLHLTFRLRRAGVVPLYERLAGIEARLAALEVK